MQSKLKAVTPEEVKPGKTKGIIFGASGVGKTWFTLSFPAPYYIDTEGGADLNHYQKRLKSAGGVYMGQESGSLDFAEILNQMQALATEKHNYKTLIIDSITKIYQTAIANESERIINNGKKDEFGASKKPAIGYMRRLVNWASKLDMNIWFVAHETIEWGELNGQRSEIGKIPDVWEKLVFELDLGIRVIRKGNSFPPIGYIHKSRLVGFPQFETFPLEYEEFAKRYGKDYIESESKNLEFANISQIDEIKRLIDLLKIPHEEYERVLTKARVDTWDELTKDYADKTLIWLNNKLKGVK